MSQNAVFLPTQKVDRKSGWCRNLQWERRIVVENQPLDFFSVTNFVCFFLVEYWEISSWKICRWFYDCQIGTVGNTAFFFSHPSSFCMHRALLQIRIPLLILLLLPLPILLIKLFWPKYLPKTYADCCQNYALLIDIPLEAANRNNQKEENLLAAAWRMLK